MKQQFAHDFEHNQLVIVSDATSPHYRRIGEIWVISLDTVKERNPDNKVSYTITFTDDEKTITFYEDQLSAN